MVKSRWPTIEGEAPVAGSQPAAKAVSTRFRPFALAW